MNKQQENPQETSRAGVQKVKVSKCTYGNTLRTRARVRENFYGPTITLDVDAAVDYALKATHNSTNYRSVLCFYCLRLGLNTFLDQLDLVLARARSTRVFVVSKISSIRRKEVGYELSQRSLQQADAFDLSRRSGDRSVEEPEHERLRVKRRATA